MGDRPTFAEVTDRSPRATAPPAEAARPGRAPPACTPRRQPATPYLDGRRPPPATAAAAPSATPCERFSALDHLSVPVILCLRSLAVVHANPAAHRLVAAGCGLLMVGGALMAETPDAHAWLARVVAAELGPNTDPEHGPPRARVLTAAGHGAPVLAIAIAHVRCAAACAAAPEVMVVLHCPEPHLGPPAALLRAAFGLSDGEIRILRALVGGNALTAVARRLRLSHETVRSHVKTIFAKTGTHRQAELVGLVLTLSALPWPRR